MLVWTRGLRNDWKLSGWEADLGDDNANTQSSKTKFGFSAYKEIELASLIEWSEWYISLMYLNHI